MAFLALSANDGAEYSTRGKSLNEAFGANMFPSERLFCAIVFFGYFTLKATVGPSAV
jgi:hypothetical protein